MTEELPSGEEAKQNPAQVALKLYDILEPLPPEVRNRAITAVRALLGEPEQAAPQKTSPNGMENLGDSSSEFSDLKIGPRAMKWIQKHSLTRKILDEVFHLADADTVVTASRVLGNSKREMTQNCYLLLGACGLIKSESSNIDDSEAIALCKRFAAYDKNNHPTFRKEMGNKMTGDKSQLTLTAPGEIAAAEMMIKAMSNG